MEQKSAHPAETVSSAFETLTRVGRVLVPLVVAAAITGAGMFVFFELVTLLAY
ncbi:hypothetical protein AB7C87_12650 [Natrarchaeobius sp. A-rgal3]|uniref:hypothetical protein n=1 Tax=Natrarchaeobius versutus TaxID=1679078 RepID=UPI00351006B5